MEWLFPSEIDVPDDLREAVGGDPLVAEILARRGITSSETALAFLDPSHYEPAPPDALPDVDVAAARLHEAIEKRERILVWGDFDVDGQTSTSLLVDALRALDADVGYHIPHRQKHGHGVALDVLREHLDQGMDVILTCDTGVAAHEAAEMVKQAGATLLITDHHALPPTLPDAPAVVNPQRLPEGHPLRDLPGVGVAYILMQQLYALAGRAGEERQFLDLVALGIVSDVATQQRDTRYLLQMGLSLLRSPQRMGLQELMKSAQVDPGNLSADTIGFQVGPRLNALGRLDDASRAVTLLTTTDRSLAQQIVAQLEVLNNRRKQIEDQIYGAAQAQIARDPALVDKYDALVLAGERWHPGVIGIVASRLVEQYNKPVVLLSSPQSEPARGSARSVPGVDIGAAIAANEDLLLGHGGHPGAAGCALEADLVPQFRRRLSNTVADTWDRSITPGRRIDALVPLSDLSMELAEDLDRLAPFGAGNPPIHLVSEGVRVISHRLIGLKKQHRRLVVEDEQGTQFNVMWWRGNESAVPQGVIDLLHIPRINDYKGNRSLQLEYVASRPTPGAVVVEAAPQVEFFDLRNAPDPLAALPDEGYVVWAEALQEEDLPFDAGVMVDRDEARQSDALVIWTIPPGSQELTQMRDLTGARRFYVIGAHVPESSVNAFLKRLTGLAKFAMREYAEGVSVAKLAKGMAQREVTIRRGLDYLAARGVITIDWVDGDHARLSPGGAPDVEIQEALLDAITALLNEADAFRAYFRSGRIDDFFMRT